MNEEELSQGSGNVERGTVWQAFIFFSITLGLTGLGAYLMADYLWKLGWTDSSTLLWILFVILFGYLAFGFTHAFFGFFLRRFKLPFALMPPVDEEASTIQDFDVTPRVAIIIPVYNEPVDRVFAGIRPRSARGSSSCSAQGCNGLKSCAGHRA